MYQIKRLVLKEGGGGGGGGVLQKSIKIENGVENKMFLEFIFLLYR